MQLPRSTKAWYVDNVVPLRLRTIIVTNVSVKYNMVIVVLNSTVTMINETTIIYLLVCLASSLCAGAFVWTYALAVDRVMSQIISCT